MALTAYLNRLYGPITALSNVQVDVMTTLVSFERVFEVLDLAPLVTDKPGAADLPRTAAGVGAVEFDVTKLEGPPEKQAAVASGKILPVQKDGYATMYDLDAENVVKLLDANTSRST